MKYQLSWDEINEENLDRKFKAKENLVWKTMKI